MKRRDEVVVGATVVISLAMIIAGALWLSESDLGRSGENYTARFRTVGGLGVGDPVVLRGVRVGRVAAIKLGERNWVEAELQIYRDVALPEDPAIVAASASLFGEWQAGIISLAQAPDDPNLRRDLNDAVGQGEDAWPGATLPDIGQLTAQAGRIATDIASFSSRVQEAFDSSAVRHLQRSIQDFGRVADEMVTFVAQQTTVLASVGGRLAQGSDALANAAVTLQTSLARVDSATNQGELEQIINNTQAASQNIREASKDFNELVGLANENQQSLVRMLLAADSVMSRIVNRQGTLGMLVGDTTLYVQTLQAVGQLRTLLADIQANPRKYFKFSVF